MKIKIVVLLFLLWNYPVKAGRIRTINIDASKMRQVNLLMGRSTVLRFKEKLKRAVVGNENYFNVVSIPGTYDITIQPLAPVSTNLFVYGLKNTYGILLKVGEGTESYDDLVNLKWQKKKRKVKRVKKKKIKRKPKRIKRLRFKRKPLKSRRKLKQKKRRRKNKRKR